MPMAAEEIVALIKQGIPDAEVEMQDLAGDGDHWAATVVSPAFSGKTKIQQHQMLGTFLRISEQLRFQCLVLLIGGSPPPRASKRTYRHHALAQPYQHFWT